LIAARSVIAPMSGATTATSTMPSVVAIAKLRVASGPLSCAAATLWK
jgi:hypothetical protein